MTTTLTACIHVPQLLAQLAVQQLAVPAPFAVVADTVPHALILDCCTTACQAGVVPGMRIMQAIERCPELQIVTIAPSIVDTARATIEAVLDRWSDEVVPWSDTDWLLHMPALGVNYAHAPRVSALLQQNLHDVTGLQVVMALAPTRFVAQIAARDAALRGNGQPVVVLPGTEAAFLAPLPIERMPLVGARTTAQLSRLGITTIGQLAALPLTTVVHMLGPRGALLHQQARGLDVTRCHADNDHLESTWQYAPDACADPQRVHAHVQRLTERVGRRLRTSRAAAGSITVTVQWVDGRTHDRTERFRSRVDLDSELANGSHTALRALLQHRRLAVLAVTVRLEDVGPRQQTLFDGDPRCTKRQHALDQIKHRHGTSAILFAWMLPRVP